MFYKYYMYNMFLNRSVRVCVYIYIYRERERGKYVYVHMCGCVGACECVYISFLRIKVLNRACEIIIL